MPAFVASWVSVRTPDGACTPGRASAAVGDDGFVAVTWPATCPQPVDTLVLDFSAFFALDRRMEIIVTLDDAGARRVTVAESPLVLVHPHSVLAAGLRAAVAPERLAFVLLIVLVAVIVPDRRTAERYRRAPSRAALQAAGLALAGYALADLVGALGWIAVAPRLGIAATSATLAYAAVEIAMRPDVRWRSLSFVAFGLVHGIAHAPADASVRIVASAAASAFAIALLLPLVRFAVAGLGVDRYRRRVLPVVASAVCLFGTIWFARAVFGT